MRSIRVHGNVRPGGADVCHLEKLRIPSTKRKERWVEIFIRGRRQWMKKPEGGQEDGAAASVEMWI